MCSESHHCTLAEYIICTLPLQAVTSQRGCRVPGNHYQPLMILSELEHSWLGGGRGSIRAAAPCALGAPGLWLHGCCTCPIGIPAMGTRFLQPMGTVPPHPSPGCPSHGTADPECCSALSLPGGTTEKQTRLFSECNLLPATRSHAN
ncbi:hypothetical protein Nmel_017175 [Mimus melanotis]